VHKMIRASDGVMIRVSPILCIQYLNNGYAVLAPGEVDPRRGGGGYETASAPGPPEKAVKPKAVKKAGGKRGA